uniref:Uncharacterized protein n=1 Tax=Lactuca sativa TaxID=4236 RepID=A0A9R1WML6_LACSA|nr:hypothetical protein LSAT_V11C100005510 [Lactuca sativa]
MVGIESGESWIWYLSRLKKYIGDMSSLAIISEPIHRVPECILQTMLPPFVDEYESKDRQARENIDFVLEAAKAYRQSDFKESLAYIARQNQLQEIGKVVFPCGSVQYYDIKQCRVHQCLKAKRILVSMLRRLSIGGSTNPPIFGYSRLIKVDMR